jgi:hypothetical protein
MFTLGGWLLSGLRIAVFLGAAFAVFLPATLDFALGVAFRVVAFFATGFRAVAFFATGFLVAALAAVFFGLAMIFSP